MAIPFTEEVEVNSERMPICMETFLIAVGARMKLSGFGQDAFGKGIPFTRPEDWYLKEVANIAFGDKAGEDVPEADDAEMALFQKARRHLPPSVYNEKRWKQALRSERNGGKSSTYSTAGGGLQISAKPMKAIK